MAAGVLFDAPGPATVARHRIYTIVAVVAARRARRLRVWRLYDAGQFEYALWEPFVTPDYMRGDRVEAWLDTLKMAVLAVLGAVVFGLVFGVGKLSDRKLGALGQLAGRGVLPRGAGASC